MKPYSWGGMGTSWSEWMVVMRRRVSTISMIYLDADDENGNVNVRCLVMIEMIDVAVF